MYVSRKLTAIGFDFGQTLVPAFKASVDQALEEIVDRHLPLGASQVVISAYQSRELTYYDGRDGVGAFNALRHMQLSLKTAYIADSAAIARGVMHDLRAHFVSTVLPFDYVSLVLEDVAARGFRMGILSNWTYPSSWLDDWAKVHGLRDLLTCVVSSADLPWRKPSIGCFTYLANRLDVGLDQMAYVGNDYTEDVLGAWRAGCGSVSYLSSRSGGELPCGVSRYDDLAAWGSGWLRTSG